MPKYLCREGHVLPENPRGFGCAQCRRNDDRRRKRAREREHEAIKQCRELMLRFPAFTHKFRSAGMFATMHALDAAMRIGGEELARIIEKKRVPGLTDVVKLLASPNALLERIKGHARHRR